MAEFYIWGSYAVTAVLLAAETVLVLARARRARQGKTTSA